MKLHYLLLSLSLASALPMAAHADTLNYFELSTTLKTGSASGLITIDTTTGVIVSGDFSLNDGVHTYTIDEAASSNGSYDTVSYAEFNYGSSGYSFQLTTAGLTSLVNYKGGPVCSSANSAGCQETRSPSNFYFTGVNAGNISDYSTSGTLTPTPEPSSLALLGTGILGLAGVARRRLHNRTA